MITPTEPPPLHQHDPQRTTSDRWLILAHEHALGALLDLCRAIQQGPKATPALLGNIACRLDRAAAYARGHSYIYPVTTQPGHARQVCPGRVA
jgi:hypothetical protein